MEEALLKLHSKEFIASLITSSFVIFYIIYPLWLVPGTFFLSFLSLLSFISIALVLFGIIFKVIPDYEIRISKTSFLKPFYNIKDNKFLFLFLGIAFGYIIILIPSLTTVFTARGDEGWHVGKIVYLANIYSLSRSIPFLVVWIISVLLISCILFFILLFSHLGLAQIKHHYKDHQKWYILGTICLGTLTLIGSLILVSYLYQYTETANIYHREKLIRFGPIHPLTSLMIFLLLPWNDFALKLHSLIMLIFSAFVIRQIFLELCSEKNIQNQIFAILTTVLFLFFPIVITYASLVYLTTGVVFFFTITTFTLVKYLKTSNRTYLFLIFILIGIGFLWKTVHLFCAIGVGLTLILHLLFQKRYYWRKTIINYLHGGVISSIFIVPWLLLSMNPELYVSQDVVRFDLSLLFTKNIFDYFLRANIEMGPIGILCYFALALFFFWSILEKKIERIAIFILFLTWYLPFNLDVGWGHYVDRFMVPSLSLLALSLFLLLETLIKTCKNLYHSRLFSRISLTKPQFWLKFATGALLISTLGFTSILAVDLQEGTPNKFIYLPIDELALYIANNMNSSDVVYLGFGGVTPVYFYIEKYYVQSLAISTMWAPIEEQNLTNFLNFLDSMQINFFVFPFWGNEGYYSSILVNELIQNPFTNEYQLVKQINEGELAIYIWKVL